MKHFTISLLLAISATLFSGSNALGQINHINTQSVSTTSNANMNIPKPTGLQVGDIMIASILQSDNNDINGNFANAVSFPNNADWTVIDGRNLESDLNATNGWRITVLYRIATLVDVAATNFTFDLDAAANNGNLGAISAFRGVDNANPFDLANGTINVVNTDDLSANAKINVTANAGILMLGAVADDRSYSGWNTTSPGGLTELYDIVSADGPDLSIGAAFGIKAGAGTTTGTGVAELSDNENDFNGAILIVLRPAPILPTTAFGCNGQYYISHGPANGANGATSLEKLTFSGLTLTPSSFPLNPGIAGFNAMGLNPTDGYIYAVRYPATGAQPRLVKIGSGGTNQTDLGAIGNTNNDEIAYSGCFDANGDFYFTTSDDRLMKITAANLASRTATQVDANGFSGYADIAINPVGGQMYGTINTTGTNNYLFPIDKSNGSIGTGQNSSAIPLAGFFAGLFFDEVGNLFGYMSTGPFYRIDKATGELTAAGSAVAYTGADGCGCSFGRVYHELDFPGNDPLNQLCPSQVNPNPIFNMTVSVVNQTGAQQSGLTYKLYIGDPQKRFRFTETGLDEIKNNLIAAGVAVPSSVVTLSTVAPATGTNYNQIQVTNFRTGTAGQTVNFVLKVQLYSTGGSNDPVQLQSEITGLVAPFGPNDLSNDPTTVAPDDPTTISFCPGISLPVDLLSFSGSLHNQMTSLNWVAENLQDFSQFEIERSSNGVDFTLIGSKDPVNTLARATYLYNDDLSSVSGKVFYYRLKMVDLNGRFKYSNVILVRNDVNGPVKITINPNPVLSDKSATVRFEATTKGTVNFMIVDMAGRVILTQQNSVAEGVNSISLNKLDRLQPGIYLLQMNDGATTQTAKFTVAR